MKYGELDDGLDLSVTLDTSIFYPWRNLHVAGYDKKFLSAKMAFGLCWV
jgi:hypothetical protein